MDYKYVFNRIENKIAIVTISNSPGNKLNTQVYKEIIQVMLELEANDQVRAIIITGDGKESFIAGADINEIAALDTVGMMDLTKLTRTCNSTIENLNKPVIAGINGDARGGGLELALSCDLRIASETAQLALHEINLGVIPGGGGSQRIQKFVGEGIAKELLYFGSVLDAERAYMLQIVNKVVPQNELLSTTIEWAEELAEKAPIALRMMKLAVNTGASVDLESALTIADISYDVAFSTEDCREGIAARLEDRKPKFHGK